MIQQSQRLTVLVPGSSGNARAATSDATLTHLRQIGQPADAVDNQRGRATLPVTHDPALPNGGATNLENAAAVVDQMRTTLTQARDMVAGMVNRDNNVSGDRTTDAAPQGAHTLLLAPEVRRTQPSSESRQTGQQQAGTGHQQDGHIMRADTTAGAKNYSSTSQTTANAHLIDPTANVGPVNYVISEADATAIAIEAYSQAFPGVQFTRGELLPAIAQLRTGAITPEELKSQLAEGANLINNPDAMLAEAQARAPGRFPNKQSTISQELRLARLAKLMEAGILPENKFTINGVFSYNEGDPVPKGVFSGDAAAIRAMQGPKGPAMLGRDLAKSIDRFKTNVTNQQTSQEGNDGVGDRRINKARATSKIARAFDPKISLEGSGQPLIHGTTTPPSPPLSTVGGTGRPANGGFSLSSASLSDLSSLKSELNDRSDENTKEPPPPPPPSGDPIALDLNHDGKIGTTGTSTAKDHADKSGATVAYDLDGDGRNDKMEWMKGDGDGLLIDDRDGGATRTMKLGTDLDRSRLFGDESGKYANGYEKLAGLDTNHDGKVSGKELEGLKVWIDDGNAILEEGELKTLAELGISDISVKMELKTNDKGETLMRSTFTQNGKTQMSEDVWFGMDGKAKAGERGFLGNMQKSMYESTAEIRGKMLRRLDAAIVEINDMNKELEERQQHTLLTRQAVQHISVAQLGGTRI